MLQRSRTELCRWLNVDLWGEVLDSYRPLRPLFKALYRPFGRRFDITVLRIDIIRPRKIRKRLSRYAKVMLERRKLAAFYNFTQQGLINLAKREKHLAHDAFGTYVAHLESLAHIVAWRTGMFNNPNKAKHFIRSGLMSVMISV